ncbi:hypothetical protein LINPERHAP1_LOCUS24960, partial [Linum perenne]
RLYCSYAHRHSPCLSRRGLINGDWRSQRLELMKPPLMMDSSQIVKLVCEEIVSRFEDSSEISDLERKSYETEGSSST